MQTKLDHPLILAALAVVGLVVPVKYEPPHAARVASHDDDDDEDADADAGKTLASGKAAKEPPGLWPMTKRVLSEVIDNDLMTQAAAMTFYTLLSIFPGLAMLVSLFGLFADPSTIMHQIDGISGVLPGGGQALLTDELKSLTSTSSSGLGWALVISVLTSLWTTNQAMKAMFNALNKVHNIKEKRSFFTLTGLTLLCTFGTIVFMVVALGCVVVIPAVLAFVGLGFAVEQLLFWLRWPVMLCAIAGLLAIMFRFGPCRTRVVWRWITWGSGFSAVGWVLVSFLFSWYVSSFGNYNKTYGSLGAVIGFMTWIWISNLVVLVGAQVDAELEKTTVGRQRSRVAHDETPAVLATASA